MLEDDLGLNLVYKENASPEEVNVIREGIISDSVKAHMDRMTSFAFFLKNSKSQIIAGILGYSMYGLLYTDMLWVHPEYRNKRLATKLLNEAENLGRKRKCTFTCLVTMSWQALPMYQKLGYQIEFISEGFRNNTKMYHLRKSL